MKDSGSQAGGLRQHWPCANTITGGCTMGCGVTDGASNDGDVAAGDGFVDPDSVDRAIAAQLAPRAGDRTGCCNPATPPIKISVSPDAAKPVTYLVLKWWLRRTLAIAQSRQTRSASYLTHKSHLCPTT